MNIKPIKNSVLFKFLDATSGRQGKFSDRTRSGIILTNRSDGGQKDARWGQVVAVGPDAEQDIKVGEYILIEPLMWTFGVEIDGEKLWKTDPSKVMAVTDDAEATVQF
jgi:co-chaperonin GroES (HSP10)